jgi:hypothetical protein
MATPRTTVRVRLDRQAINRELRTRDGTTGRVLAGFAGSVTYNVRQVFKERAGGIWWRVTSSITESSRGLRLITVVHHSRPHRIVARNAPALVFFWEKQGVQVVTRSVNHPGSTPPQNLVLSGIERAGRRLVFTPAGQRVVNTP